jgi:hypothetical protein
MLYCHAVMSCGNVMWHAVLPCGLIRRAADCVAVQPQLVSSSAVAALPACTSAAQLPVSSAACEARVLAPAHGWHPCSSTAPSPQHLARDMLRQSSLSLLPARTSRLPADAHAFSVASSYAGSGILHSAEFSSLQWQSRANDARLGDVLRVHDWPYVQKLMTRCTAIPDSPSTIGQLDGDTAVSHRTFNAALQAAGAVCDAVRSVMEGEVGRAPACCNWLHMGTWLLPCLPLLMLWQGACIAHVAATCTSACVSAINAASGWLDPQQHQHACSILPCKHANMAHSALPTPHLLPPPQPGPDQPIYLPHPRRHATSSVQCAPQATTPAPAEWSPPPTTRMAPTASASSTTWPSAPPTP